MNAWGTSWGTSWAISWGDGVAPPQVEAPRAETGGGIPSRRLHRRRYIMPDGRIFIATTDEVLALLKLYSVPKEALQQLTAPTAPAVIRAPQIMLEKRDVRFVPVEDSTIDTWRVRISEVFTYRAPPEIHRQAEIAANRIRADEEALLLLI